MNHYPKNAPNYSADPHLSQGTKEYLKVLNSADKPVECLPVEEARKLLADAQAAVDVDVSGIEESEKVITEGKYTVKLTIVRPEGKEGILPAFIFLHGGGWVLGDYSTHKRLVRDLVVESGYVAVFVNYSLSPEAKYPQAIDEIYAATKWVAEHGDEINVDGKRIAMVGNSAGGNMAIVTCLKAKEHNGPEIKAQILMWPVTDANCHWESFTMYANERFLTSSLMEWMFDQYTTDLRDRISPHLAPLNATVEQLRGLPPTLIEVAENDILRDEGEALGRKLDEAGVEVTTIRFNGVIHDWGMLNGFAHLPQVRSLIQFSAATLKNYLG